MIKSVLPFLAITACLSADRFQETLYSDWGQSFSFDRKIYEEISPYQHLVIFENPRFGRVLGLDGVIQTTEADEAIYHEMMAHVPLFAHGSAKYILIIGGGDGGMLREVLRHPEVEQATMVEIDASVIDRSIQYLPHLSQGAFDDPRAEIIVQDAALFVKNTDRKFDVIICDSTDPMGPGEVLFTEEFYGDCEGCLNQGGIFVNQNGVPFLQPSEISLTYSRRKPHFENVGFYLAAIPTYAGGFMAFGWATDRDDIQSISLDTLRDRMKTVSGDMFYYTPEIHKASFSLPHYIERLLQ